MAHPNPNPNVPFGAAAYNAVDANRRTSNNPQQHHIQPAHPQHQGAVPFGAAAYAAAGPNNQIAPHHAVPFGGAVPVPQAAGPPQPVVIAPAPAPMGGLLLDVDPSWRAILEPILMPFYQIQHALAVGDAVLQSLIDAYKSLQAVETSLRENFERYKRTDKALAERIIAEHLRLIEYMKTVQQRIQDLVPGPHQYTIIRSLKDTIYGKIKLGRHNRTGTVVAIKMSAVSQFEKQTALENPVQEIRIMRLLSRGNGHPHVVRLLDEFRAQEWHWTVLEFCGGGEFFDVIANRGSGFDEPQCRAYFRQIISAVQYIHGSGVVHLDLSLENLLVDDNGNLKICDFGMGREIPHAVVFEASPHRPGKLGYMAPEIFACQPFNPVLADIYSIGVILFIMLTGTPPYNRPEDSDARFQLIYSGNIRTLLDRWGFTGRISLEAMDLLSRLLGPAHNRLTLDQILQHPWMQSR